MALTRLQKTMAQPLAGFRFLRRVLITASGDYTPHADCDALGAHVIGGGGGSGHVPVTGVGEAAAASGGGGGGYAYKFYDQAAKEALVFPLAVTVGAAGLGGVLSPLASATAGTASLFGAGGPQGSGGAAGVQGAAGNTMAVVNGGAGGSAGNGDINARGFPGGPGLRLETVPVGGEGGHSIFGGGAPALTSATGAAGSVGVGPGAGGSGARASASQAGFNGGNGVAGLIIVDEYAKD